jgi:hypothetical protein
LLALPDDSPAPEVPVPVNPDIIDNLIVCEFANGNYFFDNVPHLNGFTDGCNILDSYDCVRENICCKTVCLDSDIIQFDNNFVGNNIILDDSLARERFFVNGFFLR